jgi:hypothetical protein
VGAEHGNGETNDEENGGEDVPYDLDAALDVSL